MHAVSLRRKVVTLVTTSVLSIGIACSLGTPAYANPGGAPSDSDIEQAYAQQSQTASSITDVEQELTDISERATKLETALAAADSAARTAENKAIVAQADASLAVQKADAAQSSLELARIEMARIAQGMYQNKASTLSGAILFLQAEDFAEASERARAFDLLANTADEQVKRMDAMTQIAQTLQRTADLKLKEQEKLAAQADAALDKARAAVAALESEREFANARKAELAAILAQEKGTTAELEMQRLSAIEASRIQAVNAASKEAYAQAEANSNGGMSAALKKANTAARSAKAAADAAARHAADLKASAQRSTGYMKQVNERAAHDAAVYAASLNKQAQQAAANRDAIARAEQEARQRAEAEKKAREKAAAEAAARAAAAAAAATKPAAQSKPATPQPSAPAASQSSNSGKPVVDLSAWQNPANINYDKLAASISGAIIRIGYTGSLTGTKTAKDTAFETHYRELSRRGVPIGIYWYSLANEGNEGANEARAALNYLGGKSLSFPIYIDVEDPQYQSGASRATLTAQSKAFAQVISSAGYRPGIYASSSWYRNKLDAGALQSAGLRFWVAQWSSSQPSYPQSYGLWQYTSSGRLPGYGGALDLNRMM